MATVTTVPVAVLGQPRPAYQDRPWISCRRAAAILGTSAYHIRRLADAGLVKVLQMPCHRPLYRQSDVVAILAECQDQVERAG